MMAGTTGADSIVSGTAANKAIAFDFFFSFLSCPLDLAEFDEVVPFV